jgi:hypothetical protein
MQVLVALFSSSFDFYGTVAQWQSAKQIPQHFLLFLRAVARGLPLLRGGRGFDSLLFHHFFWAMAKR